MNELMNYIDAIKEKITDVEYKQLCDKMMELNTQRKTSKNFYRVWYVNVKTTVVEDDDDHTAPATKFYPEILNKIIKLSAETVETMRRTLDNLGYCYMDKNLLELERGQASLSVIGHNGVCYIEPKIYYEITVTRIEDME
jgi:hypothetical protein